MAEIRKQVLGEVVGALGDIVFRARNGKNFVGVRPASFIPGTDSASVARRLKFLTTIRFSQAVNSEPVLNAIWDKVRPPEMSTFNNIARLNYQYTQDESLTDLMKIVPGLGFGIVASSTNLTSSDLTLDTEAIGLNSGINTVVEVNLQMISVLFFSDPIDESVGSYYITTISSIPQSFTLEDPLNLTASLLSEQTVYYDKFREHKAFTVLVTLDAQGNPVHYSGSIVTS